MFSNNNNNNDKSNSQEKSQNELTRNPRSDNQLSTALFENQPMEKNYLYFFAIMIKIASKQTGATKENMTSVIHRFYETIVYLYDIMTNGTAASQEKKHSTERLFVHPASMIDLLQNFRNDYFWEEYESSELSDILTKGFSNHDEHYSSELWHIIMKDISHHYDELKQRIQYSVENAVELDFINSLQRQKETYEQIKFDADKSKISTLNSELNKEKSAMASFLALPKTVAIAYKEAKSLYDAAMDAHKEQLDDLAIEKLIKARSLLKPLTAIQKKLIANCEAWLIQICYTQANLCRKLDPVRALNLLKLAYDYMDEFEALNINSDDLDMFGCIVTRDKLCLLTLLSAYFYFNIFFSKERNKYDDETGQLILSQFQNISTEEIEKAKYHQTELLDTALGFFEVGSKLPNIADSKQNYTQALLIKIVTLSNFADLFYAIHRIPNLSFIKNKIFKQLESEMRAINDTDLDTKDKITLAVLYKSYAILLMHIDFESSITWVCKAINILKSDSNIPEFIITGLQSDLDIATSTYVVPPLLYKAFTGYECAADILTSCQELLMMLYEEYFAIYNDKVMNQFLSPLDGAKHPELLNNMKYAINYLKNLASDREDLVINQKLQKILYFYAKAIYDNKIVVGYAYSLSLLAQAKALARKHNDDTFISEMDKLQRVLKNAFKEKNQTIQRTVNTIVNLFSRFTMDDQAQTASVKEPSNDDEVSQSKDFNQHHHF